MRTRTTDDRLPRHVYLKHGSYYYVEPGTRQWIRLAKDKEEAIALHRQIMAPFLRLRAEAPIDATVSPSTDAMARAEEVRLAALLFEGTRCSAKVRNLRFALTKQDVFNLVIAANGKCMLTDIPFSDEKVVGTKKRLWRPSIDRIDSSRGYEVGNVRLICVVANFALSNHGDAVFEKLAVAYVLKRLKSTPTLVGSSQIDVEKFEQFFTIRGSSAISL